MPVLSAYQRIPLEAHNEFFNLAMQLSPENLTCDGELSRQEVDRRARHLRSQWKNLETQIGFQVTESDVYAREDAIRAERRRNA